MGPNANSSSYEDVRRKRIEENKKRMLELGFKELSKSLNKSSCPSSATVVRSCKKRCLSLQELGMEQRRSSRVAAKPVVDYKDHFEISWLRARCGSRGDKQSLPRRYFSDKARMAAIEAAEEITKGLENPCILKPMLHSHTASGFWLGLPAAFCKVHLPLQDGRIMLQDEQDKEWETIYLAKKVGLSGGWRGFSLDHNLVNGDACVFELVSRTRFKIHIVRASEQDPASQDADEAPTEGGTLTAEKKETKRPTKKSTASYPAREKVEKSSSGKKSMTPVSRKLRKTIKEEMNQEDAAVLDVGLCNRVKQGAKEDTALKVVEAARSGKRKRQVKEDEVVVLEHNDEEGSLPPQKAKTKGEKTRSKKREVADVNEVIELESDEDDVGQSAAALQSFKETRGSCRTSRREPSGGESKPSGRVSKPLEKTGKPARRISNSSGRTSKPAAKWLGVRQARRPRLLGNAPVRN